MLLVLLFLAMLLGTWVFLRTERGNEFLRERLEWALEGLTPYGRVEIGRLETDVWNDIALYDVAVYDDQGELLAWISRALLDVRPGIFITRRILRFPHARLDGVYVDLELREDGVFNLARVFGQTEPGDPDEPEWRGLPVFVDVPDLIVDGAHIIHRDTDGEIVRATGVDLQAGLRGKETIEVRDLVLTGLLARPGPTTVHIEGDAVWNHEGLRFIGTDVILPRSRVEIDGLLSDTWQLDVDIEQADFPTIDPLIDEPGLIGTYAGRVRITGPIERPTFGGYLTGIGATLGQVALAVTVDFDADPVRISGRVDAQGFHLHHLVPEVDEAVILNGGGDFVILADSYPEDFVLDARWSGGPQVAYGQRAEHLSTHFRIERGVLNIVSAHVLGVVGDVNVTGTIDIEAGPMRLEVRGEAWPVYLADFGIEGLGTPATIDVVVSGNIHDLSLVRVGGTAAWSPFLYEDRVALSDVAASFQANVRPDEVVTGTARVVARGGTAWDVEVGMAVVPDLQFLVPLGGGVSQFRGTVQITEASRPGLFRAQTAQGPFVVTAPSGGELELVADLEVGAHTFFDFPGTSGRLRARLVGDVAEYDLVLRQDGRHTVESIGVVDLGVQRFVMSHLVLAPTPRATWTAVGSVRFTVTEGGLADADVLLRSELGIVDLRGTLGTSGPLDAEILARSFQLDTLAELFPDTFGGLSGTLDMRASVAGSADDPLISAELVVKRLWVPDAVRWLDVAGTLEASRTEIRPNLRLAVADDPLGHLRGTIPVVLDLADPRFATERPVDLLVAIYPGTLERFELAFPALAERDLPEGRLSASLMATGPLGDPDFRLAGVAELPSEASFEPTRFEVDLRRDGGELVFWADIREGMDQRASITGTGSTRVDEVIRWVLGEGPRPDLEDAELWLDDMVVNGILLGVPAATVARMLDADVAVTGDLVGGFSITGSPYEPRIEGGLHLLDGSLGDERLEGAWVSIVPDELAYDVELVLDFLEEGSLEIRGELPLRIDLRTEVASWPSGEIDLQVTGEGLPLGALSGLDPGVRRAEGLLVIEGVITGTIADPMPVLEARINGGELVYEPIGLRFYDIRLQATADARGIEVPLAAARTAPIRQNLLSGGLQDVTTSEDSQIRASGSATLENWRPADVDARALLLGGTWIAATPEAQLRMNGEVLATGTWPEIDVTGQLELVRGNVTINTASTLTAAPLELDPSITLVRPGVELVVPEPAPPPPYTAFDVAIDIDLNRNLFLDMTIPWIEQLGTFGSAVTEAEIDARLGGEVELTLTGGEPALVGEVEVIEGEARVLRSEFDTLEGTLIWVGGDPANPNLDLFAEMTLPGGSLAMTISGTAEAPRIAFQSDAYPDQSQQLAILVTGRPPGDIGGNQAVAAAETLAGVFFDALFQGQALSQVGIEPDGTVEVGVPIGTDLFAATRVAPQAGINENRIELLIEWSLARRLVLAGAVGDRRGWIDLFWEIRF